MKTPSKPSNQPRAAISAASSAPAKPCVVTMCGAGAVGRALADHFPALGVSGLNVIDPKCYTQRSIATQCGPGDVGRFKADVVASLAQARGLNARAYTTDLFNVSVRRAPFRH